MTTVYNITVADYHTYTVGNGEVLVHNKAMKNKYDDEGFGYKFKRDTKNSRMKPGHDKDNPTIDAIVNKHKMSEDERQAFHRYIQNKKGRGETLPWKELDKLAKEFIEGQR
jgi:formiminotetrahydrofolate cyclodeaminase